MSEVVVATWNLHHGVDHRPERMAGTWGFIRDVIAPTVALVQESDGVPATDGGCVISPSGHPRLPFETAVVGYTAGEGLAAAFEEASTLREERRALEVVRRERLCAHRSMPGFCEVRGCSHHRAEGDAALYSPGEGPRRAD